MGGDEQFPQTSWTLLEKASAPGDAGARARGEFAQRYYKPVRAFLFVLVRDAEQAQELAQEFFTKVSGPGGLLEHARPGEGKFRHYLKQALRHLVIDYYRSNRRHALQIYPDQASDGGWEVVELPGFPSAEAAFHREWVKITLNDALTRVRTLCLKRKQDMHLDLFQARYLSDADHVPTWEELGARYGLDQKTARERADTVARHFRFVLRRMLRNEITGPGQRCNQLTEAAIDEEIQALLSPLRD
jgi:RNA polymerase sigma factor (sigma-70 family)